MSKDLVRCVLPYNFSRERTKVRLSKDYDDRCPLAPLFSKSSMGRRRRKGGLTNYCRKTCARLFSLTISRARGLNDSCRKTGRRMSSRASFSVADAGRSSRKGGLESLCRKTLVLVPSLIIYLRERTTMHLSKDYAWAVLSRLFLRSRQNDEDGEREDYHGCVERLADDCSP